MKKFPILILTLYQKLLSPILMIFGQCRFYPTCSAYAKECFEKYSAGIALKKSFHRLCKCHPYHIGGVDYP